MIDTEELLLLVSEYIEKHELAKELGSEYMQLNLLQTFLKIVFNEQSKGE